MQPGLESVLKKIRQVFPGRDCQEVLSLLEKYGIERHETGQYRVYLAILKLCDEEQLSDPSHYVKVAKTDFRDVLAWAESPNKMTFGPTRDPVKSAELTKMDQDQYRRWLNKT